MDSNVIRMLIFYEKGLFDSANSLAESFRHNIKENKIFSKDVIKVQLDFIKYFKILLKFNQSGFTEYDCNVIEKEISGNKSARKKSWLLDKIEILKNKQNKKTAVKH